MRVQLFAIISQDTSIPHEVKAEQWVKHIRRVKDYSRYWYNIFDSTKQDCAFVLITDEEIEESKARQLGNSIREEAVTLPL